MPAPHIVVVTGNWLERYPDLDVRIECPGPAHCQIKTYMPCEDDQPCSSGYPDPYDPHPPLAPELEDVEQVLHGLLHVFFDGEWMRVTDECWSRYADNVHEAAEAAGLLWPGRHPAHAYVEDGTWLVLSAINVGLYQDG
jgi:hypothetical protein